MKVVYSSCNDFNGTGIGYIGKHTTWELNKRRLLAKTYCLASSDDLPRDKHCAMPKGAILSRLLKLLGERKRYLIRDSLFDNYVSSQLQPSDIFHVWCGYGKKSMV